MTLKKLQAKINDIESKYYKGWHQSEEWWRITGNIDPSDRELWIKYNDLYCKKYKRKLGKEAVKFFIEEDA